MNICHFRKLLQVYIIKESAILDMLWKNESDGFMLFHNIFKAYVVISIQ